MNSKIIPSVLLLYITIKPIIALIKGPPEVSTDYLDRYVAKEGDTLKLNCPISGFPRPIIEWYQDEHLITSTWDRFRFNRRYLKIKSVLTGDSGVYICKGVNGFGSKSVQINVIVKGRKELYGISSNSEEIHFHSSEPDNEVMMRKNIQNGITFIDNNQIPNLEIRTPSPPPTMIPSSLDGVPPKWIRFTKYHPDYGLHFQTGELLKLECLVEGSPPPTIVWFKDGDILITPNLQDDRSQTALLIPNLQIDDSGLYKCKARNAWGEVNSTFPVKVHEKVGPPHMLDGIGTSNVTAEYGQSILFACQVQSLGPTQIQWLKQLHKHQEPKNKNKTIVVFDYVFEILHPQSKTTSSGGYYNSTLLVESTMPYSKGRYICLVNNQVGHTHKEIFLHINRPVPGKEGGAQDSNWTSKAEPNPFPLSFIIIVPILSVIIVFLLFVSVFILRKHTHPNGRNSNSPSTPHEPSSSTALMNSRQILLPHLSETSPHMGKINLSSNEEWFSSNPGSTMWKKTSSSDSSSEKWVEVTNKANQTPVHWAYGDVYIHHHTTPDILYPSNTSTEQRQHSPLLNGGYSIPKGNEKGSNSLASTSIESKRFLDLREPSYPEYYAVVTAGSTELYARPPSDHFYFKISDGKTEFI